MSDYTRETQQEGSIRGQVEEGGGGGAAQVVVVVEEEGPVEGGEEVDAPARPGEDDQIQQQEGAPQGPGQQPKEARWYKKKIRKAKGLFLLPFRKINKFYARTFRSAYYYYGDDPGGWCCRCFRPPPAISPSRLPNPTNPACKNPDPSSYEFVKYLIESNDFYDPQCNVHGGSSRCPPKARDGE